MIKKFIYNHICVIIIFLVAYVGTNTFPEPARTICSLLLAMATIYCIFHLIMGLGEFKETDEEDTDIKLDRRK